MPKSLFALKSVNKVFESEPEFSGSQSDFSDIDDDLLETGRLSSSPDETTQYINSGANDKSNDDYTLQMMTNLISAQTSTL